MTKAQILHELNVIKIWQERNLLGLVNSTDENEIWAAFKRGKIQAYESSLDSINTLIRQMQK